MARPRPHIGGLYIEYLQHTDNGGDCTDVIASDNELVSLQDVISQLNEILFVQDLEGRTIYTVQGNDLR